MSSVNTDRSNDSTLATNFHLADFQDFPSLPHTSNQLPSPKKSNIPTYSEITALGTQQQEFTTWEEFLALPTRPDLSIESNYDQLFVLLKTKIITRISAQKDLITHNSSSPSIIPAPTIQEYTDPTTHSTTLTPTEPPATVTIPSAKSTTNDTVLTSDKNLPTKTVSEKSKTSKNHPTNTTTTTSVTTTTTTNADTSSLQQAQIAFSSTPVLNTTSTSALNDSVLTSDKNLPTKTVSKKSNTPKNHSTSTNTAASSSQAQTATLDTYTRYQRHCTSAKPMEPPLLHTMENSSHNRTNVTVEHFSDINLRLTTYIEQWNAAEDQDNQSKIPIANSLYFLIHNFQQIFMTTLDNNPNLVFPSIHPIIQQSIALFNQEIIHDIFEDQVSATIRKSIPNYCCPTYSRHARIHKLSLEEIPITLFNISTDFYHELHQLIYFCLDTSLLDIDDTLGNLLMTLFFHRILKINFSGNTSNTISTFDDFHLQIHTILSHFSYYNFSTLSALDISPYTIS
jgi:hypothetical protein